MMAIRCLLTSSEQRKRLFVLTITALFSFSAPEELHAKDVVIHAGRVIDGVSKQARGRSSIVLKDDRIVSVGDGFVTQPGATVIDLSDATVLPGLIDSHVHMLVRKGRQPAMLQTVTQTPFDSLLNGVFNARSTLYAGFASVRDVGDHTSAIVALKKGIEAGTIEGPRMWVSGHMLGPTGGHSDERSGYDPAITRPEWDDRLIDGVDSAIRTVRRMHREGVNLIKISPSGGITSVGDDPRAQLMTDAEIDAVVRTAHTLGMKVAAHVFGAEAIVRAARLGVDSIEHGSYADGAAYAAMREHGTYLVPTMTAGETGMAIAREHPELFAPSSVRKMLEIGPIMRRNLSAAYRAGVPIAFGTDAGMYPHGQNMREFALMVDAGMKPMDVILSATGNAARLIGAEADIGTLQPGRFADVIAVRGNPAEAITALETPIFVMKGGSIIVDERDR